MKKQVVILFMMISSLTGFAQSQVTDSMLIRISEIEVYPEYLNEYLEAARNVGTTSVKEETGVVCIFPMQMKRDKHQIRIVEIYASMDAYRKHIVSKHFQTYKQGTLHMVKSLDLVDMNALAPTSMSQIFLKAGTGKNK